MRKLRLKEITTLILPRMNPYVQNAFDQSPGYQNLNYAQPMPQPNMYYPQKVYAIDQPLHQKN